MRSCLRFMSEWRSTRAGNKSDLRHQTCQLQKKTKNIFKNQTVAYLNRRNPQKECFSVWGSFSRCLFHWSRIFSLAAEQKCRETLLHSNMAVQRGAAGLPDHLIRLLLIKTVWRAVAAVGVHYRPAHTKIKPYFQSFAKTQRWSNWVSCEATKKTCFLHSVDVLKFGKVYFCCNNLTRCHYCITVSWVAEVNFLVWEFSHFKPNICHGFWRLLSLISGWRFWDIAVYLCCIQSDIAAIYFWISHNT